jgi:hypothetical protein
MKNISILSILVLLCFSLSAQDWKFFSDTSITFTARYPSTWINKIKENKRVFFTSPAESENDNFRENVNVSVTYNDTFGTTLTIKDVIDPVLAGIKEKITNFNKENEQYFKWNNENTCELTYTGYPEKSEILVRIIQRFCFSKGRLFTVTYTSHSGNLSFKQTALKIMNSIVFK